MSNTTYTSPEQVAKLDLTQLRKVLRQGRATDAWQMSWIEPTWREPDTFRRCLYHWLSKRTPGARAAEADRFDFYRDAVTMHLGLKRSAFICEHETGDAETSYDELHARSGGLASAWRSLGVGAGANIALLLPVGVDYAAALLAALRLGAVVCALPGLGRESLRRRVELLAPDFVVGNERQLVDLGELGKKGLPCGSAVPPSSAPDEVLSHAYPKDEPVLRCFSAFGADASEIVELPAAAVHFALFRDAVCAFGIDASDTVAVPDFEALVAQPTLLLSVLFSGGRWSQWLASSKRSVWDRVAAHGVTVLGVRPELRERLLEGPWPASPLRQWLRLMTDRFDAVRWEELAVLSGANQASAMNLVYSAAAAGVVLAGVPKLGSLGSSAAPAAGQEWQLDEIAASGLPALGNRGQITMTWSGAPLPAQPRLAVQCEPTRWICGGCLDTGPDCMIYPSQWVVDRIQREPGIVRASVVVSPGNIGHQAWVTLLLFTNPLRASGGSAVGADLAPRARRVVRDEFGAAFEPTRVEIFPLRPRMLDGEVDHGWCRSQYLSGSLSKKNNSELFRALSRLGTLIAPIGHN